MNAGGELWQKAILLSPTASRRTLWVRPPPLLRPHCRHGCAGVHIISNIVDAEASDEFREVGLSYFELLDEFAMNVDKMTLAQWNTPEGDDDEHGTN